jgi:hypothetical protein
MSFLTKLLSGVAQSLFTKALGWFVERVKSWKREEENERKNKEAIDKVKKAKTKEEIDAALDALDDRTTNK